MPVAGVADPFVATGVLDGCAAAVAVPIASVLTSAGLGVGGADPLA